jgi:hypothetical protein
MEIYHFISWFMLHISALLQGEGTGILEENIGLPSLIEESTRQLDDMVFDNEFFLIFNKSEERLPLMSVVPQMWFLILNEL